MATAAEVLQNVRRHGVHKQLADDRIELIGELQGRAAAVGRAERDLLRTIVRCDNGELWRDDDCRNTAEWLAQRLGISRWKAQRWVNAAHALEDLPRISAALEAGVLSLDKVVELTRFAAPKTEKKLVSWARRVTPRGIRDRADRELTTSLKDAKNAQAAGRVELWQMDEHMGAINGYLPNDRFAVVVSALDDLADQLPDLPDEDRELSVEQRRADALVALASAHLANDQDPDRATVVVHAPLAALTNDEGNCAIAGGGIIHPETARRLACDARLRFVITDEEGNALGIGETSRTVPHWLRRQVFHRDGNRCTFPNCEARRFLHPHHIKWWTPTAHGERGPSDLPNLITVCTRHHTLVHEHRWSVTLGDDGTVTWFRPSGRVYEPGPAPPEPDELDLRRQARELPEPKLIEARRYSPLLALAGVL